MKLDGVFLEDLQRSELLGVTHFARRPEFYRGELALDAHLLLLEIKAFIADLEQQAAQPNIMRLTRDRLKRNVQSYQMYLKFLEKSLGSLGSDTISTTEYSRSLGRQRSSLRVNSYLSHLAKDWGWGETEALEALKLLQKVTPPLNSPEVILTLGAGACRLPYEAHRWLRPKASICTDLSPLLLSLAQKIIRGSTVELIDFADGSIDIDSDATMVKLKAPEPLGEEFKFIVHDLAEWGLRENSVDVVITPWIVDAAPLSSPRFFQLINSVLKPGGCWLNIGPLIFKKPRLSENYSPEEVLHLVEKNGFKIHAHDQQWLAHMKNPLASQHRVDHVLAYAAVLQEKVEVQEETSSLIRPAWMLNPSLPIQFDRDISKIQLSALFTLDLAMKATEGLSIRQLTLMLSERHSMPKEQAEYLILSTLEAWVSSATYKAAPSIAPPKK